jgi:exoribonuclease R
VRIDADLVDELADGLQGIRRQFKVPEGFPDEVEAAAAEAVRRPLSEHVDRTDWPFVTLDPASSTDLDQAFHIEPAGDDLLLHYAIADVGWFVDGGDPLDREAWVRGTTQYLPDGRAPLYPTALSEAAASLLPDGPRPAVVFHVRIAGDGRARLDGATRAVIRSRAKLAYDSVTDSQLPSEFGELSRRIRVAEEARGAARVDPPEQVVEATGDGGYRLVFRPRLASEESNAAMSLATNLAVAEALYAAGTGLFRVMPEPDRRAVARLRHTANAFGVEWPAQQDLAVFERGLDPNDPAGAAMMLAIRRAGGGAEYVPFDADVTPWHAAMAATYAHATAPLRRLADRYVVQAALAIANGRAVPEPIATAFALLAEPMRRADALGGQIERAVIDLAEAVLLAPQVGDTFAAVITDFDERGARAQLCDYPVVTRVVARSVEPGESVRVKLTAVDIAARQATFVRVA